MYSTIDPHSKFFDNVNIPQTTGFDYRNSLSLQPQAITNIPPDSGFCFIDTTNNIISDKDRQRINFRSDTGQFLQPTKLISLSHKIRIDSFYGDFAIVPNVNPRNNKFVIKTDLDFTNYTVTIPEGLYYTQDEFMDVMVEAMNNATSGITPTPPNFSWDNFRKDGTTTLNNRFFKRITATNGNFKFIDSDYNLLLNKGKNLATLPIGDYDSNIVIGPIKLQYSRYCDVVSTALTKYKKRPLTSNNKQSTENVIFRIIFNPPIINQHPIISVFGNTSQFLNFYASEDLYSIDIKLIDENGDLYYLPNYEGVKENSKGFNVGMSVVQQ